MLRDELRQCGVCTDHLRSVPGPSGQAIVMLQPGGQNSIIIVGGANTAWPELSPGQRLTSEARGLIREAGAVLLQREVPEEINLEAATVSCSDRKIYCQPESQGQNGLGNSFDNWHEIAAGD